ncbi:MAG: TonB-dependent receptor [Rikenellaceae bacterium]
MNKYKLLVAIFVANIFVMNLSAEPLSGTIKNQNGEPLVGASIWWEGTTVGVTTDTNGGYRINKVKDFDKIIASYVGYSNDTIVVENPLSKLDITLSTQGVDIESVVVNTTIGGNYIKYDAIAKDEMISFAGLCKMACCNLAESFENSASVTVGYSDAISGARQIKMLGLTGTYTQILDENRPVMRGLSSPYGLSYTPGMWLNSIQVSKGISSVTAGHEAITGQINLEYRKPTDSERLFLNLYLNNELRPEINLSSALPVSRDGRLSTVVMFHASADTNPDFVNMDHNADGFRDMPLAQQYNIANRWSYLFDNGVQIRWGVKFVEEDRLGGEESFEKGMREDVVAQKIYGSNIQNRGANGYIKIGAPVGRVVYDTYEQSELRSNVAFVADYDLFDEDAYFGLNDYSGREKTVMLNGMYNHYFTSRSSLIVGASATFQDITERLVNSTPWLGVSNDFDLSRVENEVGLYGEYTFKHEDTFSIVAGLRGDYNSYLDRSFITPRGQVKWSVGPSTTLRASAGMGYRSSNVITDNIGILATGRSLIFDGVESGDFDPQERALTLGGSITQRFRIISASDATISFDYFRTEFGSQVIVDQEMDGEYVHIYSSQERSTTDSYQVDLTWKPNEHLDLFATFRYTKSDMTLNNADGTTYSVERPLVSRFKTLVNAQYATHLRRWTFDLTAQLNGPSRMPNYAGGGDSPIYPIFFAQVSRRVRGWEIYAGCENIGNYTQHTSIIGADNPFSSEFNSTAIWGPLMGRKFYVGARFNLY